MTARLAWPLERLGFSTLLGLPKGGAMFARLREMLDRWLKRRKGSQAG